MSNTTISLRSYKLAHLDYENLTGSQRRAVVALTLDMNRVRKAVVEGEFESLITVDNAIAFLSEKAAELGGELPASFIHEVRTNAVTRSLERAESYPQVVREGGRLVRQAREGLEASDQNRYRFFSGQARNYYEKHRLPTDELDKLEESASINPFFTSEGAQETPQPRTRTINPFE